MDNLQVFYVSEDDVRDAGEGDWRKAALEEADGEVGEVIGWYYWWCFPGCLPDSDACGPYGSEELAIAAAAEECE